MPPDKYIRIGSINTRYWEEGEKGSPVILIHGLGASAEIWMHNVCAIAEKHRVYVPDLVGFGLSDKPEVKYSPSYMAAFINDFMTALSIKHACLVGNSLGGGVALQFTLQYPERVQRLVLADSAGLGREMTFIMRLATIPLVGELMTQPNRMIMAYVLKRCVYDPAVITDDLVNFYYKIDSSTEARKSILSVLRSSATIFGGRADVLDPIIKNIGNISVPSLIIWGRQDRILPFKHACFAAEKIPNAKLHVFDQCGHMPNFERPREFNTLVLNFLNDHT
ncbi:MAG TPA: alpha/beta fold hydrolase [Syntrophales bacterium]|nr:alpha/beta fold hydrolase [Syntrophales bacterium]